MIDAGQPEPPTIPTSSTPNATSVSGRWLQPASRNVISQERSGPVALRYGLYVHQNIGRFSLATESPEQP